jgi:hypothetical protein
VVDHDLQLAVVWGWPCSRNGILVVGGLIKTIKA